MPRARDCLRTNTSSSPRYAGLTVTGVRPARAAPSSIITHCGPLAAQIATCSPEAKRHSSARATFSDPVSNSSNVHRRRVCSSGVPSIRAERVRHVEVAARSASPMEITRTRSAGSAGRYDKDAGMVFTVTPRYFRSAGRWEDETPGLSPNLVARPSPILASLWASCTCTGASRVSMALLSDLAVLNRRSRLGTMEHPGRSFLEEVLNSDLRLALVRGHRPHQAFHQKPGFRIGPGDTRECLHHSEVAQRRIGGDPFRQFDRLGKLLPVLDHVLREAERRAFHKDPAHALRQSVKRTLFGDADMRRSGNLQASSDDSTLQGRDDWHSPIFDPVKGLMRDPRKAEGGRAVGLRNAGQIGTGAKMAAI